MLPTQDQIECNELKKLINSLPGDDDVKETIYQRFFKVKDHPFIHATGLNNLVFPQNGNSQTLSDEQSFNFHFLRGLIYVLWNFRHDENFAKHFAEHWGQEPGGQEPGRQEPEQHKDVTFVDKFIQKRYNFKIFDYSALILSDERDIDPKLKIEFFKKTLYEFLEKNKYSDAFNFVESKFDNAKKGHESFYRQPYYSKQFFEHEMEKIEIAKKFFDKFIEKTKNHKSPTDKIHLQFEQNLQTQDFEDFSDEVFDANKPIQGPEASTSRMRARVDEIKPMEPQTKAPTSRMRAIGDEIQPMEPETDLSNVLKYFPRIAEITTASNKIAQQLRERPIFYGFVNEIFKTDYIPLDQNIKDTRIGQKWLENLYEDLSSGEDSVNGEFIKKTNKFLRDSSRSHNILQRASIPENEKDIIKNYYESYKKVCTFFKNSCKDLIKTSSINGSLNPDLLKLRFILWIRLIDMIQAKDCDQTIVANQLTLSDKNPNEIKVKIKEVLDRYKDNDWIKKLCSELDPEKLPSLLENYLAYSPDRVEEINTREQEERARFAAAPNTSTMPREKYQEFVDLDRTTVEYTVPYQRAIFFYNSQRSIPKNTPTSYECRSFKDEEMYNKIYNFITKKIKNNDYLVQPKELNSNSPNSEFSCDQVGIIRKKNFLVDSYYFAIRLKNSSNNDFDCTIFIGHSLKCKFDKVNSENADSFYFDPSGKKSASDFVSENSKGNVSYIKPEILKKILDALNNIKQPQQQYRFI